MLLENLLRNGEDEGAEAVAQWVRDGRAVAGDRLPAGAGADAGLHGRAGDRRPGGDARRDGGAGWRRHQDQPAGAGRAGDRPFDPGRRVRGAARVPAQRRARVRAQPRALRLPALGAGGLRQLQGGAAEHRHLPPGEPRVPRPGGGVARRSGVPGHARRDRLAHDDDQRAGRARLGRGRHRGGGGHAGPAGVDAGPAGGGLQAHRRAAGGLDGDRPGADRDADAARARRRRQVRGVLRAGPAEPAARRPRDDREHVAGDGRHLRDLPGRRGDAPLPRVLGPAVGARGAGGGVLQGAGPLPRRGLRGGDLLRHARARPRRRGAVARGPEAPAGPRGAVQRRGGLPGRARGVHGRRTTPTGYDEAIGRVVPVERPAHEQRRRRAAEAGRHSHPQAGTAVRRARGGLRPRLGGDRGDHELHQHLEPVGDGRRGAAGEEGGRGRARADAVGEDLARAGLEGRDGVPRARRPDRAAVAARLRPGRLRLHDLHRELGAAAGGGLEGDRGAATWWWRACCPATATSRAASTPR